MAITAHSKGFTRLVADLRDRLTVTKRMEETTLHMLAQNHIQDSKDTIALIDRLLAIEDDVEFITNIPECLFDDEGYYGKFE